MPQEYESNHDYGKCIIQYNYFGKYLNSLDQSLSSPQVFFIPYQFLVLASDVGLFCASTRYLSISSGYLIKFKQEFALVQNQFAESDTCLGISLQIGSLKNF